MLNRDVSSMRVGVVSGEFIEERMFDRGVKDI